MDSITSLELRKRTAPVAAPSPSHPVTPGPLPQASVTPECRAAGTQWPDMHASCRAPGYQSCTRGWVAVPCACKCHEKAS